jgi:hypothetical protein
VDFQEDSIGSKTLTLIKRNSENLIEKDLVSKLGLEVHDHPHPYPLGWVNKDVELRVTK